MKAFFDLHENEKRRFERSSDRASGYSNSELTKQQRDSKEIFDIAWVPYKDVAVDDPMNRGIDGWNIFPNKGIETALLQFYYDAVKKICLPLLEALCLAFEVEYDALKEEIFDERKSIGFMRLNKYTSPGFSDGRGMNIHEHTDAGLFTVLWTSNIQGLEYLDRSTGNFIRLNPVEIDDSNDIESTLSFTVNIGDMWEVITNGLTKAPIHRVICGPPPMFELPRYSIALFANPNESAIVSPDNRCIERTAGRKRAFNSISWFDFRKNRFAGDFADKGRENQIEDYSLAKNVNKN